MGNTILVVLFTIAKIFGIILLVFLLLILLLLFAPVRYRVDSRLESRLVKGCVSWLGFVVRIPFRSEGSNVRWRLHILGIPIMSSKKKTGKKVKKRTARRKKTDQDPVVGPLLPHEEEQEEQTKETEVKTDIGETDETHTISDDRGPETDEQSFAGTPDSDAEEQRQSIFQKLLGKWNRFREKIKDAVRQLVTWIHTVRDIFQMARKKISSLQDLKEILQSDHGKAFICIGKENVLHLLRQIRPRKVKGDIIFGSGDPCTTGEILGILSVVYAWLGTGIKVTPDFMEKRLEGRIQMRGRIRIITLVCIALRIILNKEGKKLQQELQKWKEDF